MGSSSTCMPSGTLPHSQYNPVADRLQCTRNISKLSVRTSVDRKWTGWILQRLLDVWHLWNRGCVEWRRTTVGNIKIDCLLPELCQTMLSNTVHGTSVTTHCVNTSVTNMRCEHEYYNLYKLYQPHDTTMFITLQLVQVVCHMCCVSFLHCSCIRFVAIDCSFLCETTTWCAVNLVTSSCECQKLHKSLLPSCR